jgi:hypothetical protein
VKKIDVVVKKIDVVAKAIEVGAPRRGAVVTAREVTGRVRVVAVKRLGGPGRVRGARVR